MFWYRFVRSVLTGEKRYEVRGIDYAVFIIGGIGIAALLINIFTGWVFSFDGTGDYHRGPLFFVPAGATFLCIIIAEVFVLMRLRNLGRNVLVSMLIFPLPPLIGGAIAMFLYGVPWMPLGIALSMVMLFAALQDTSMTPPARNRFRVYRAV